MDRKMMRSYLFGRRVKYQYEQLVQREYDAIAELHADHKDKDKAGGKKKETIMMIPFSFKDVNADYDNQKTNKDRTNTSKSAGNMKT